MCLLGRGRTMVLVMEVMDQTCTIQAMVLACMVRMGGLGGSYNDIYGNNMYSGYGGLDGGSGIMYGSGMYNSGFGGPVGGYGMGMGGPYANEDPNNPYGPPSSPPSFWMSFLRVMQGVVNFFGRISILIDQNTQAFHLFMTALSPAF